MPNGETSRATVAYNCRTMVAVTVIYGASGAWGVEVSVVVVWWFDAVYQVSVNSVGKQ